MSARTKKERGRARSRTSTGSGGKAADASAGSTRGLKGGDRGVAEVLIPALRERTGASAAVLKQVGMEVLREDLEPAAWARALVAGSGTRDDTMCHYARIRVEVLTDQEQERRNRKSDFEVRQKSSFRDVALVPVVPPGSVVKGKVLGGLDAVFWHAVAMVAGVGTLVAANLLWPDLRMKLSWQFLAAAVVAMQLIPFIGWRVGRGGMYGVTYSQASQIAACLAMLGSVGVGCGLLMGHPPRSEPMAGPVGPRLEHHMSTTNAPESPEATDVTALPLSDETVAASEER